MNSSLEEQLKQALSECERLRSENAKLQSLLGHDAIFPESKEENPARSEISPLDAASSIKNQSSAEEKIALFRSLFRGREDIYPIRWESRSGRSGYSPACGNEWDKDLCRKPQIKCSECPHSKFLSLGDKVIFDHLSGQHMIGVYPLLQDETCWFLAIDFDKGEWQQHVEAFLRTCDKFEVPAALERSQSGNGAHVWFFFDQPIPAALARKLGCALITQTMNVHYRLGFDSYDRLFPSQDTMPKGGFGNLDLHRFLWVNFMVFKGLE